VARRARDLLLLAAVRSGDRAGSPVLIVGPIDNYAHSSTPSSTAAPITAFLVSPRAAFRTSDAIREASRNPTT